jgi:glucose/arabinose dehydrogenase
MVYQQVKKTFHIALVVVAFSGVAAWAQTVDVAWTFGSVDSSSYRLDAIEPADVNLGPLDSEDPTLALELGKRYQVKVTDFGPHPFEVIAKGASSGEDTVLLSMTIQGPFESDPDVNWEDDGQGTVRFTLTTPLYQAMAESGRTPGYRCRIHPVAMRGDFAVAGLPIAERIAPSSVAVNLEVVASGLMAPVALVPDPAVTERLYVVDQAGLVRVIDQGQLLQEPFLDVRNLLVQPLGFLGTFDVNDFDERGFLGLAFHPDFTDPTRPGYRRLYTYTSEPVAGLADFTVELPPDITMNHQSVVREWQLDPVSGAVNPTSSRVLLRIDEPQFNHNAGHITFGPDGYLYIALGDGGGANDTSPGHGTTGNGQNINVILGKLVRIDPLEPAQTPASLDAPSANGAYRVPLDNPFVGIDGVDEIYAYGFRNPYRFSFDALSGALIVADVGQGLIEEIDIVNKGGNYGWNRKEGSFKFDPAGVELGLPLDDPALIDPVAEYDHDDGISVIGGHTYYGSEVPELWGRYICGDFSRGFRLPEGRLLVADLFTGEIQELLIGAARSPLGLYVKGIGQDRDGEIYVLASTALGPYGDTGVVLKIVSTHPQFVAALSGAGAGTDSTATGGTILEVSPDGNSISYRLTVEGIENVTQAHIHVASTPGGNGSPAVWLYPAAPPAALKPGQFTGVLGEGQITDASLIGPLAGQTLADLLRAIRENRAYVNVHTQKSPGGEIRGSLGRAAVEPPISAELSGPGAGTNSQAIGRAILRVSPEGTSVSYELEVLGIANVTQAHIHVAAAPGGTGSPAVWLYPAAPPTVLIPGEFRGVLGEGSFAQANFVGPLAGKTLNDLLTAIREDRAYVNIHTQQFPGGEIRGRLR